MLEFVSNNEKDRKATYMTTKKIYTNYNISILSTGRD